MLTPPSFFEEIGRITASDYIPTEADILRSHKGIHSVSEHRFMMDELSIHLIDVGTQRCERRKWIHQFEDITAILYVVDLACYDQVVSSHNAMMEQIQLFDSVVNSKWFTKTTVILFLSNISVFRQKLARNPLGNYFPDYSGGTNVNRAGEYLLERFSQVNRAQVHLYSHLVDPYDTSNIQLVFDAIMDKIISRSKAHGFKH
jgi:guanine nucleotide-binding protein G(i) subunit alpha